MSPAEAREATRVDRTTAKPERVAQSTVTAPSADALDAEQKALEAATAKRLGKSICKRPPGGKIYYGEAVKQAATVGVRYVSEAGKRATCTGVIIADDAILTAGHCSCGSDYQLWFGDVIGGPGSKSQRVARDQVLKYPGYSCNRVDSSQPGADYALIKFRPEALGSFDERQSLYDVAKIMPPAFARSSRLAQSNRLLVVGYGLTERDTIGEKRAASIPVRTWECSEAWAERRGCQPFSEFILSELGLSGTRLGQTGDSCGGDSGGPAFARVATTDKCGAVEYADYLVGITSRGMWLDQREESGKRCGGGGIYQVVARYPILDWLRRSGVAIDPVTAPLEE